MDPKTLKVERTIGMMCWHFSNGHAKYRLWPHLPIGSSSFLPLRVPCFRVSQLPVWSFLVGNRWSRRRWARCWAYPSPS